MEKALCEMFIVLCEGRSAQSRRSNVKYQPPLRLMHAFFHIFCPLHICLSLRTFNYSLKHQSLHLYLCPKKCQSDPPLFHHGLFGYKLKPVS